MKISKLGSCRIKFGVFGHVKILVNTCWPRMQKFTSKVKSSLKNVVFWRCGQNGGDYLEYRSSEHDTLFKTLLRDVFSSKLTHSIISLKFMEKIFFRKFDIFHFFSHFYIWFYAYFLTINHLKNLYPEKLKYLRNEKKYEKKWK